MGLKLKHGTAAAATAANETLELAELGYETDTGKWKVGDGVTAWTSLPYLNLGTGTYQPLDSDLTTIAGLTPTTDNIIQSVAGAWASRTPAQVKAALAIAESDVTNLTTDLAAKQPLDSDLTTIAGLTATTDNFIVSVASAWASRTPAQVRTTLSLVIGTNVQAWDADLDTWATKTAPSGTVVGTSDAQTLTNKRRTPRAFTTASTATLTPEIDTYDLFDITALAANLTIANHSTSTPTNGEQMRIRLLDNLTPRTITWGTNYSTRQVYGSTLPSTTVGGKYMEIGLEWFAGLSKWVVLAVDQEV